MYQEAEFLLARSSALASCMQSTKGRIVLFRPDKNAERLAAGAARLSMPAVPEQQFVEAVKSLVAANRDWVGAGAVVHG